MDNRTIITGAGGTAIVLGLLIALSLGGTTASVIFGFLLFTIGCGVLFSRTKATVVAGRELSNYFVSPVAYILTAAYLLVIAFFFNTELERTGEADMQQTFGVMTYMALFICPIITMRLFSEEARSGTLETMLTAPISDFELAVGKFLGAFSFFALLQVPTLVFVYILARFGNPDIGIVVSSYIGILLLGGLLLSIGLLISALTKNQVISAFVGFVVMFIMFFLGYMGQQIGGSIGGVIEYSGAVTHYLDFSSGLVNSQHVVYYLSLTVLFVFFSVRAVESHKWR